MGTAVPLGCQIWPCPEKSTLVSRQKGRKLFFGRRWGTENVVEQERVETPKGPGLAWRPLSRALHSRPSSRPLAGVPTQGALMLTCSPTPGRGQETGYHVRCFEWETANCCRGALRREPPPPTGCAGEAFILGALGVIFGAKSKGRIPSWPVPCMLPEPGCLFSEGHVSTVPEQCNSARQAGAQPSPEGKGLERTAMSLVIAANPACGPQ